ncbi:tRNA (32-2'-O)-methyltransferase regulator THADA isoform X1 [Hydra vulgaris]|uniref:tRNA (32-2'-O)-methyltransferase regulator THADA isoform X1 n=2 Tax=Hydra vulgaris TaxID=6087 RepID=UPI001F5FD666|nr:thyroid adenoma-associated protein homolog isoform X1 [Hydra vulgaris]
MSHRLKKKDSPSSLAFVPDKIELLLKIYQELNLDVKDLKDCISCITNGKDQLGKLKELNQYLVSNATYKDNNLVMLCEMYINCVSKHPLRRKLASMFQLFDEQNACIFDIMAALLRTYLNFKENDSTNHIRNMIELISALMENFPLGDKLVQKNSLLVFAYLKDSLIKFQNLFRVSSNPMHQTDILNHIHVTFKTILLALNKCGDMEKDINKEVDETFKFLLKISIDAVINEVIVLDCRASAAMVMVTILLKKNLVIEFLLALHAGLHKNLSVECFHSLEFDSLFLQLNKPSVELVLLNALLTKLPTNILVSKLIDGDCLTLFKGFFILQLIKICESLVEKSVIILAFKTINTWIDIAMRLPPIDVPLDLLLQNVLPHLMVYVDHHIDTVRHSIVDSIKKSFQLLSISNHFDYIITFMKNLLNIDLQSRGKICIMILLVQYIRVEEMLELENNLPKKVMSLLTDVDLSSHACNLYKVLSEKHLSECREINRWIHLWTENIYEHMIGENKEIKANIVEYIIPNLLSTYPLLLKYFINDMKNKMTWSCIRTSLIFLKSARSMKNTSNDFSNVFTDFKEVDGMWKNLLNLSDMKMCLTHLDQQVRLDTLSLICNTSKSTDPVTSYDILLLQHFLHFNMAVEDASFRHQVITEFKKLFLRIFAHAYKEKNNWLSSNFVHVYLEFFYWFVNFIIHKLYASAPYCQISLSLQLLSLLTNVFNENKTSYLLNELKITEEERINFTNILLKCFEDTYDPNRMLAFDIILKKPVFVCTPSSNKVVEMFKDSIMKIYSAQPDSASVAAYYLTYIALDPDLIDIVSILQNEVKTEHLTEFFNAETVLSEIFLSKPILFAHLLLFELKKQLNIMKSSLIKGSQNAPLYGTLYTLRLLFQFNNWSSNHMIITANIKYFSKFLEDLIEVCLEIISLVSPYVTSEAPEGHLCDVSLVEVFQQIRLEDFQSVELQSQVARMILVCCWRSMKEVSLLLGVIVSNFSEKSQVTSAQFLTKETVNKIWNMFCDILLRSKHAGAYELASLGFIELCSVLWNHKDSDLHCIPKNGLTSLINDLVSQSFNNETTQVTRRSAGIPFFLQAICITEPAINANFTLKFLMGLLTESCLHKVCIDVNNFVVAVNILRSFYKDTKLAEEIYPYVASGVIIAIQGFSSSCWAIRNSCTLLFSSLMQRIFGVKKSKMTGREFFTRFPSLYPFLFDKAKTISESTVINPSNPNATMFPLLLLLSHLYPSTLEGSEAIMKLTVFIPYVIRCSRSPVYKTRKIAAYALVPLVPTEQAEDIVKQIVLKIKKHEHCKKIDQNFIHGSLLQIEELLSRLNNPQKLVNEFYELLWVLKGNFSLICKMSYIEILIKVFNVFEKGYEFHNIILVVQNTIRSLISLAEKPGHTLFLFKLFSYLIKVQEYSESIESCSKVWSLLSELFVSNNRDLQILVIEELVSKDVPKEVLDSIMNHNGRLKIVPQVLSLLMANQNKFSLQELTKLWNILLDLKNYVRDSMRSSLLKLAGAIMIKLDKQDINNKEIFKDLWKFSFESSCENQCQTSRKAVAEILTYQMFDPSFFVLDKHCFYLFLGCCINLLRDCDAVVRQAAAVNLFDNTIEKSYIPQAQVVMEDIEMRIFKQFEFDLVDCFEFTISIIFEKSILKERNDIGLVTEMSDVVKSFVVFEEGKLNPYFDNSDLAERLVTLLKRYLTEANIDKYRKYLLEILLIHKPKEHLLNIYYEQLYQCIKC